MEQPEKKNLFDDAKDGEMDEDFLVQESRRIEEEEQEEASLAREEDREDKSRWSGFEFPSEKDLELEKINPPKPEHYLDRINTLLYILYDFNSRRDKNISRKQYVDLLLHDLCIYYGYNDFLMRKFFSIIPLATFIDFLDAMEKPRPVTIRVNTLKTKRKILAKNLIDRGVNLDPLADWTREGLVVYDTRVPLGATPNYLAGHYILQSASSFLPVIALDPRENEFILDMSASPGGKTTHIAMRMKNTGTLVSNDANPKRISSLVGNVHRMGVTNTIITNYDGRDFPVVMSGFDRVLLDAPCTGTGVISKDASIKVSKTREDLLEHVRLQKELLLAAIDSVAASKSKPGYVVYSTCSLMVEENEGVIDYVLQKRKGDVKVIDTGITFGSDGITRFESNRFHQSIKLARRIYPHLYNMDGFFICKLKVTGNRREEIIKARKNQKIKRKQKNKVRSKKRRQKRKRNNKKE